MLASQRLKSDLVNIFNNSIKNKLNNIKIKWKEEKSMTIVLCANGYPGPYKKNLLISNINKIELSKDNNTIYQESKPLYDRLYSLRI